MTSPAAISRFVSDVGALVASHGARARRRDLSGFQHDPVGFCRTILKGDPWSMQRAIMAAVRDHPLSVVQSCNGAGKDWTAAALALWWVFAVGGFVLVTGPTERQVKAVVMGEIHRAFARATDLPGELFELALKIPGDEQRGILAFTTNDASRLTGFHAPKLLILLTEAQGVDASVWEGLLANATGEVSRLLAVGNPLSASGRFYEVTRSPHWQRFKISAFDTPNLVEQREVIRGAVTQSFVDRLAQEFGVGSSIYAARVLGEFPDDASESLVKRSWCEAAIERARVAGAQRAPDDAPVVGLDPARFGADQSALAIRQGSQLRALVCWGQLDTMATVDRTRAELRRFGLRAWEVEPTGDYHLQACRLVIDEPGLGAGVIDRARQLGWLVTAFNGGRTATDDSRFHNRRSEVYWGLRCLLEAGTITLPPDEALVDELCATQWRIAPTGKIQLEAKDEIRGRLGRSPDRADAVVMACEGLYRPSNRVWRSSEYAVG